MRTTTSIILSAILVAVIFVPLHVHAEQPPTAPGDKDITITGAGATFPFPLIDTWRVEYNKLYPHVQLNYQSIGSGGGIKQHTQKTVDFGASDAPLTLKQLGTVKGTLHIPETIGSDVVSYNLPEMPNKGLKLTGDVVAKIFLGEIKKWNDPAIQQLNPDVKLPAKNIVTVHRSDGSGTTYIFTQYLSLVNDHWGHSIKYGTSVPWPVGVGAAGNEGVSATIRKTPYSIGYIELAYAFTNKMPYAFIQNADKTAFIEPTLETIFAAVNQYPVDKLPAADKDWSKVNILLAPGPKSYPIASFTYLLVYQDLCQATKGDVDKAKALTHMLYWMITDGQQYSEKLLYIPLPETVVAKDKAALGMLYCKDYKNKLWKYQPDSDTMKNTDTMTKMDTIKSTTTKTTTKPSTTKSAYTTTSNK
jgi:phosphate ABC transporter phosphate-binding protein